MRICFQHFYFILFDLINHYFNPMVDFQSQDPARIKLYINIIGDKTVFALWLFRFVPSLFSFVLFLFYFFGFTFCCYCCCFFSLFIPFFKVICSPQIH